MTLRARDLALCVLLAAACAAPSPPPSDDVLALRVVSYNIKHGLGMDGQIDLARVATVLAAEAPDVVLLQEVDERTGRAAGVDQAADLGARLGMRHDFAPFMAYDGGRYGLAVLTRHPVVGVEVVSLPPGKHEPRAALVVSLVVGGALVHVANAHLDWLEDDSERVAQARALAAALAGREGVVLLGGDLNDVPDSATLRTFEAHAALRRLGPATPTFPADDPRETIDHFLMRLPPSLADNDLTLRVAVVPEPLASDHRPVTLGVAVHGD